MFVEASRRQLHKLYQMSHTLSHLIPAIAIASYNYKIFCIIWQNMCFLSCFDLINNKLFAICFVLSIHTQAMGIIYSFRHWEVSMCQQQHYHFFSNRNSRQIISLIYVHWQIKDEFEILRP